MSFQTYLGYISLDGVEYAVLENGFVPEIIKVGSTHRGLTGKVRRQETNQFTVRYQVALDCTRAEIETLWRLFTKTTPPFNLIDLTTPTGLKWVRVAGTDTLDQKFGTGVYFQALGVESEGGWDETALYTARLDLLVNTAQPTEVFPV